MSFKTQKGSFELLEILLRRKFNWFLNHLCRRICVRRILKAVDSFRCYTRYVSTKILIHDGSIMLGHVNCTCNEFM